MPKRRSNDQSSHLPVRKRARVAQDKKTDRLSYLSDELLIHILSFLSTSSLLLCQRVSRRFYTLAGDSELWKRQYYSRWVLPRAHRIANVKRTNTKLSNLKYSPKVSTWLDHAHLTNDGKNTNWKRQYRLKHNWSNGICQVIKIEFPQPPRPPMLVKFYSGFVFAVDLDNGLRVWEAGSLKSCLARIPVVDSPDAPTALVATQHQRQNLIEVAVGFESGRFSVYSFDTKILQLCLHFSKTTNGPITMVALSFPYLLMVTQHKVLSLYKIPPEKDKSAQLETTEGLLLASLKADSALAPMSLSIRAVGSEIIAAIVYSFFHIGCGWSLGIQELHFNKIGHQKKCRLATTVDSQYGMGSLFSPTGGRLSAVGYENAHGQQHAGHTDPSILHQEPPTSVSYSHPYLLTSHVDNTLTMYLVVSTAASLFIRSGRRLWGHTSSVSTVQVSDRGKAVSVSSRGGEVRIWELEALVSSVGTHGAPRGDISIQASPENKQSQEHRDLDVLSDTPLCQIGETRYIHSLSAYIPRELAQLGSCIGFDDERVLLLREKEVGTQLLELYDFT